MASARALLLRHMTPEQHQDYMTHEGFNVTSHTGQHYRIEVYPVPCVFNVATRARYCLGTRHGLGNVDMALLKKLLLETDERRFLSTANVY